MFISHTYKLIFFEVPRTGSRSITQALTLLDPLSPTAVVRMEQRNLYHYHFYDQELVEQYPDYSLIAVHRNPFDRLSSHYKYRKQYGNPDKLKQLSFEQYVKWVCLEELPFEIGYAMIDQPMTELLPYSAVNYWLSFETIGDDWQNLATTMQIELPALPHINQSQAKLDQETIYTESLANLVIERFANDFEQFPYSMESWKANHC